MSPTRTTVGTAKPARAVVIPRSLRIPFVRSCTVIASDGELPGLMLDLSLKGVYVKTDVLPQEGDSLTVCFRVPGNDRLLRIHGRVAWVNQRQAHPVHSLPPGFGLSFIDPSREELILISGAIQTYCLSNPIYRQYL